MATHSGQYLQHRHQPLVKRPYPSEFSPTTTQSFSFFLKPTNTSNGSSSFFNSLSSASSSSATATFSVTPAASSVTSTTQDISFDALQQHLSAQNFRQADEVTRRLLIVLSGEATQKRGYVFFSEVQFISKIDLKAIDDLWRQYSNGKFGYSVQKKIFQKVNKDFTRFFIKVGWMKKLDTEVEQYNYRSFPSEFIWELKDDTPEGHLPLTNALRGTQLLNCILNHPAFDAVEDGEESRQEVDVIGSVNGSPEVPKDSTSATLLSKKLFKSDYSF